MPYMPEGMPLPATDEIDAKGFWEHCRKHELVVQRCTDCGTFRHPPAPVCYNCQSFDFEWHKVSGKGVVYSYMIVHHPPLPVLNDKVPYNVILVELPDADIVRITGNLIDGCPHDEIYIGMPVEVSWEDIDGVTTLPQWKRATK